MIICDGNYIILFINNEQIILKVDLNLNLLNKAFPSDPNKEHFVNTIALYYSIEDLSNSNILFLCLYNIFLQILFEDIIQKS